MSILTDLKLGTKLIGSYLFIAVLGAVVALYAVYEYQKSGDRSSELYASMTVPIWHVGEISTNFHRIRANIERMSNSATTQTEVEATIPRLEARRADNRERIRELEKLAHTPGEKEVLETFRVEREKFNQSLDRFLSLVKQGSRGEAEALARGDLDKLREGYQGAIEKMYKLWVAEAKETAEDNERIAKRTETIVFAGIAIGLALGILAGVLVTKDIKAEVGGEPNRIRWFAEQIAGGDLTIESLSDGKVTGINQAVGRMNDSLKSLIVPMSAGMTGLAASSEQVTAVAAEVRRSVNESSAKLTGVAAAAEQMQTNMGGVAAAVEESSASVASVATAAEELSATIAEISQRASQARNISEGAVATAAETGALIGELAEAAAQIGKVTETISEISEQTKLLALNATIEAARAGESGKGFAVVAQEIKELARQVADATRDISDRVGGIRRSTEKTRDGIGNMAGTIANVNDAILTIAAAVEEQAVTVNEIARNAQEVSVSVSDTSSLVSQTAQAASNVAQDVAVLDADSAELERSMSQLDQSAEELTRMAGEMRGLVGKFKV